MATCFSLIGEHRADPDRLLLLGDDGRYYGLLLPQGITLPTELDDGEWVLDCPAPATMDDPFS